MTLPTVLKWHGGKAYLAPKIVARMPPRRGKGSPGGWLHHVEPYFGGGAVLLYNDPEGISEVVNDLDHALSVFWRVLQDPRHFAAFLRRAEATPFSEAEWERSRWVASVAAPTREPDWPEIAWAFFVHARQSLAARGTYFAPRSRTRIRRGMSDQASAWLTAVEGLPAVHERLRRVVILNRDALEVIRQEGVESSLVYADPPYLHETRAAPDVYAHEMDRGQHEAMLDALLACKGKVMLSGYRSGLYDGKLAGWHRVDFDLANHAAGGAAKRRMTECLWCNFAPAMEGE
jgi:DNA adenine methylase